MFKRSAGWKQERKIVGWKFKVIDNRPTGRSKGAFRLPETAAEDQKRRTSERLTGLRLRWTEAGEEQRARSGQLPRKSIQCKSAEIITQVLLSSSLPGYGVGLPHRLLP